MIFCNFFKKGVGFFDFLVNKDIRDQKGVYMRAFFEEYGLLIVAALVMIVLIGIAKGASTGMGTQIELLIDSFAEKVTGSLANM